jgi:hypothetical protein
VKIMLAIHSKSSLHIHKADLQMHIASPAPKMGGQMQR